MKKFILLVSLVFAVSMLASCTSKDELESVGLDGLTGKEILTGIEDGSIIVDGYSVSVYDDELIVTVGTKIVKVDMPKNEFYLSVAPYINTTHECLYHSATGCRGELINEDFYVTFTDNSGNVLFSQNMNSLNNGFIDLWLPRDVEGTLTITQNDLSTSKVISTASGEPTCETTMQLS